MRNPIRSSFLSLTAALIAVFAFNGCDTVNTSENAGVIASMETFHMGDVSGSLSHFGSRNQQDAVVLTQEMVARRLEALGYREVPTSEPADMTILPGWSFYEQRNPALKNSEPVSYEQSLYQSGSQMMGRLGVEVLGGSGQVLWSSMSSWSVQASTSTTSDFSYAAEMALRGFPEAVRDETVKATASPIGSAGDGGF
ncbi:hypothetical protein H5P28_03285 [Ruficoccus amylovorans]|uniref:DUF4136 domain-containing protein n=1 Tax=Ruficoccus amylovorans TaxID=1804625 RepID=A0A842HCE5_9BACT|nr:hypothetical protein [Ruficoccus amylovorans]MBC2593277.1 hypothetical protein [Ruficoccus amylovorans]